ncbi:glycoside hydrolase family 25 protein [Harryflintia acetispora]|uniref:glycoside hydrolase family 25 protein n=1 Tax=Harryflintia acetispora TaxID=1849041 RepID=UPI001898A1DC|nr:glycoside hydrolase family 25 protein [Harryflintia acetispora]
MAQMKHRILSFVMSAAAALSLMAPLTTTAYALNVNDPKPGQQTFNVRDKNSSSSEPKINIKNGSSSSKKVQIKDSGSSSSASPKINVKSSGNAGSGGRDGDTFSVAKIKEYAKEIDNVSDDFLKVIRNKSTITLSQFEDYAVKYKLPIELIQRFYDDRFVFKSGNKFQFISLDPNLSRNVYDWDNLVYKDNNEVKYVRDGASRALKGIDVSTHQGTIDWKKVKNDGVKFAMIRVGYRGYGTGKIMLDDQFKRNIKNATANGIKVGVYFYSQAITTKEAVEEAEFVLDNIKGYDIDYPVVFDIEDAPSASARTRSLTASKATQVAKAFCERIEQGGYRPMIYTYTKYFVTEINMGSLTKYDKWVAQYYKRPFFPYKFQMLQYTSKGKVDGIKGNVDMNLCFTSYPK